MVTKTTKPIASISLDLDNQWSYMKTHGDPGWDAFPSYLDIVIPRVLSFLEERNLKITFFIVGQDAILEKNHPALRSIASSGHEIGNHSFHHEPWLHIYSEEQIDREIASAEEHIEWVTGQNPIGFRGPGYSISRAVLKVLSSRNYQYDASTLPTFTGPLSRAYYFMTSELSLEEKRQRAKLFGTIKDGFRPVRPYRWTLDDEREQQGLIEIPVTTMPILKIPFHVSYIHYLSTISTTFSLLYFKMGLMLCKLTKTPPSLLLHPLDFLGFEDITNLSFFPAMRLSRQKKLNTVSGILGLFTKWYDVLTMEEFAHRYKETTRTQTIDSKQDFLAVKKVLAESK